MLDEDTIIKEARNGNERMLIVNVLCAVLLPAIFFGGNSDIFVGLFVAMGVVAPLNISNYINSWSRQPVKDTMRFAAFLAPYAISLVILAVGTLNPCLQDLSFEHGNYFRLCKTEGAPTNAFVNALVSLSAELENVAAFLAGLSIYMIASSRFIIRKILLCCAVAVAALMVAGCFASFMWNFDGTFESETAPAYFSSFSDSAQWAAFGLIWLGVSLAIAVYSQHRFRLLSFAYSVKCMSLCTGAILFAGVMFAGKPVHIFFAFLIAAVALTIMAAEVIPAEFNAHRHDMLRHLAGHADRIAKMRLPFIAYAAAAAACWYGAACGARGLCQNPASIFVDEANKSTITYTEKMSLFEDSLKMLDNGHMLFGYGTASFPNAFAMFQGSDLGTEPWVSPNSDLLHKIIENGFVGLALSSVVFAAMLLRWLIKLNFSGTGAIMALTAISILAISIVEIPFQSVAVLVSFWVLSMSLFRWDDESTS